MNMNAGPTIPLRDTIVGSFAPVLLLALLSTGSATAIAQSVNPLANTPVIFSNGLAPDGDNLGEGTYGLCGSGSYVGGNCDSPATLSQSYVGPTDGIAVMSLTGSNTGTADAVNAIHAATIYDAEVVGPSNISVPVDFVFDAYASVSTLLGLYEGGGMYAPASVNAQAFGTFGSNATLQVCAGASCPNPTINDSIGPAFPYSVVANTPIAISVGVQAYDTILSGPDSTFSASVDPSVVIDPSFTTPGYSVVFSPSPVPVPAAAWLLLSGLGGLGALVRRGRAIHWRSTSGRFPRRDSGQWAPVSFGSR